MLSAAVIRAIAVKSSTCEESVRKVLRGERLRPLPRSRILAVLREAGIEIPEVVPPRPLRVVPSPPDGERRP